MLKTVKVTNHLGESITFDLMFPEKSGFIIRNIDGLGPVAGNINMTELVTYDGSTFNSSHVNSRNIVFTLQFIENPTIEDSRQKTYKYFPIKRLIKMTFETDNRTSEVYGYVESNDPNIFSENEGSVISVRCPNSYIQSVKKEVTLFSVTEPMFEFPFENASLSNKLLEFGEKSNNNEATVYYTGDAEVGIVIYIHFTGNASGISISNVRTLEYLHIDNTKMSDLITPSFIDGDDLIISTVQGDKFVHFQRDGITYNVLNTLDRDSDWFSLEKGDNLFAYTADSGVENMQFRVENQVLWVGI